MRSRSSQSMKNWGVESLAFMSLKSPGAWAYYSKLPKLDWCRAWKSVLNGCITTAFGLAETYESIRLHLTKKSPKPNSNRPNRPNRPNRVGRSPSRGGAKPFTRSSAALYATPSVPSASSCSKIFIHKSYLTSISSCSH